jgi:hypothetical protein
MKMTVKQEALSLGSIELIQFEFSDEVKTSGHCVPEENCRTYRLGEVMWPSAKCLGNFAPSNADVFTDKSLVELGSGTGFLVSLLPTSAPELSLQTM